MTEQLLQNNKVLYFFGGIDSKSAGAFIAAFMETDATEGLITIFFSSSGGEVVPALAMYDAIKCSRNQVLAVSVGEVASAAVLPFLAADVRLMLPNSKLFLHETQAYFPKDAGFKPADLVRASSQGQNTFLNYCNIVKENTKISQADAIDMCMHDTTLLPPDACKLGFAEGQYQVNMEKLADDSSPMGKLVNQLYSKRVKNEPKSRKQRKNS